jgi:ligand-binding sensor domain-containing protein
MKSDAPSSFVFRHRRYSSCHRFQVFKAQTRIDSWTTDNGLPQNSITGLTQTPDGYIWFTTNEGLVRFDGVRFRVFIKVTRLKLRIIECREPRR